jgi:hypothetical protein
MLLPDNIHPENTIYYNGAFVLKILQQHPSINIIDLYCAVKEIKEMSFPVFTLCIDWLFLINVANLKDERVELCS